LAEALNVIARDASLTWQINDNVVNMSPLAGMPPLLRVHISSFEWDRAASLGATVGQLSSTREISSKSKELGLSAGVLEGGSAPMCIRNCSTPTAQAMEREENVLLVRLLNRIASDHKGAVWSYSEYRCHNETNFTLSALAQ
jgi:hypothetical protein